MQVTFAILDAVMVLALIPCLRERGCRVFWIIQAIQLLEVPLLGMHPGWASWRFWDDVNIPLELISVISTTMFPIARGLMLGHAIIKVCEPLMQAADCDFQLAHGGLFWFRVELNNAIIVVLIGYAVHRAISRLWRTYAQAPS